jgi:serine/threonine protein kinase
MGVINRSGTLDIKLIDFGLAKGAGADGPDPLRVTRTQDFVGSPAFASPEQCDLKKLDIRSDIYSLGVTLWYLLTGEAPFSGSVREVMNAQVEKSPPFDHLARIPGPVVDLIRRMLEKKPEERFQTPEELQAALEKTAGELSEPDASVKVTSGRKEPAAKPESPLDAYLAVQTGALLGGRYRLLEELREGNGGRLFLASDEQASAGGPTDVALKLLDSNIAETRSS